MSKEKIKVLFLIDTIEIGGAEKLLLSSVKYLNRDIFLPYVVFLFKGDALRSDFERLGVLVAGPVKQDSEAVTVTALRLVKIINEISPDIIHTHLFHASIYGRVAGVLAKVSNIITTLHSPDYTYGTNKSFKFKLRKFLDKYSGILLNKGFTAVSDTVKRDFEEKMNFKNIKVIYNGIDPDNFRTDCNIEKKEFLKKSLSIGEGDIVLLSMGRLHKQKGHKYLLNALKPVVLKNKNIRLLIVGEGELEKQLKELTMQLGLSDYVKFIGKQKDINLIFNISDIFILSSTYEGFGMVTIEAMINRVPVIVPAIDVVYEIVTDGVDGLIYPPKDADLLSEAINKLILDPKLRKKLGEKGNETVLSQFNIKRNVKQVEEFYLQLIN